ncbi:GNAT family N-acetyltransferase [Actinacidiphila paucisporea]|uniref:L-amino acid N-acyltransferase YncA n=1 Tax=Actinacidiphila paucisporea TaxID=310782 RepID=A0A1M7L0W5_9ACTN|nr:GNAT family N-acetyltransferase [Actinacidiphila paucisporea]SHM71488.1 L-amino acid N-acyltransferase YncA [Actinacidiphila paucisporea]
MTTAPFAVRAAVPADAAAVAHVHVASREATMPYLPPRRRSDAEVEAWVRDVVIPGSAVWVAVDGQDRVVGYAAVAGGHLDALYLLAGVLRRGVGSALLGAAKAYRPGGLTLAVFQRNTGAIAFYARHGFTVVDSNDGSRNMENEPDLTMRWQPVTNSTRTGG